MSTLSINERLYSSDNDWKKIETAWQKSFIDPLSGDVWNPPNRQRIPFKSTVSVLIPAWNAEKTISACLASIEMSTLQQNYPHKLQVIVIDDGSDDHTWQIIKKYRGSLNLLAIRQNHEGQSSALNTGLKYSEGDIVIFCDADMLLNIWAIEEMALRHQFLENVLLVGFRGNLEPDSPDVFAIENRNYAPLTKQAFITDNRFSFDHAGWPENMFISSRGFCSLGFGRKFWMPSGAIWNLPRMVYGCLFSLRKTDLIRIGNYDERMTGWGFADTLIGAKAIALGLLIIPVISANGWHVKHPRRSPNQRVEAVINELKYQEFLNDPFVEFMPEYHFSKPIIESIYKWHGTSHGLNTTQQIETPTLTEETLKLFALGRYSDAASRWRNISNPNADQLVHYLRSQRLAGQLDEAMRIANEFEPKFPTSEILIEHALILARLGKYNMAHKKLIQGYLVNPQDRLCQFIIATPSHYHLSRAKLYIAQGNIDIALRDIEAVLMQDPSNRDALSLLESLDSQAAGNRQ